MRTVFSSPEVKDLMRDWLYVTVDGSNQDKKEISYIWIRLRIIICEQIEYLCLLLNVIVF